MERLGITAFGAYLPRLRLPRHRIAEAIGWANPALAGLARGERTVCNWDEDSVTMALEACRDALAARSETPTGLYLASTTLPFSDRNHAGLIAAALDLAAETETLDAGGSQRAATSTLLQNLARGDVCRPLIVAAEQRRARPGTAQEMLFGDGAAALLLGRDGCIAEYLGGASLAADLVDHYRAAGERFDYTLEERWVRDEGFLKLVPEAARAALARAACRADDIDRLLIPAPQRVARAVAAALGIRAEALAASLDERVGDTGVAAPLLALVAALEAAEPGERLLVIGFGQGVDALVWRTTPALSRYRGSPATTGWLAERREEMHYSRFLAFNGLLQIGHGMRGERDNRTAQSAYFRKRRAINGFVGGRCSACGTVQFPRTQVCVNPECRAHDTQQDHRLADSIGHIKSYTEDWLAFSQRPPLMYGNVGFDGGANVMMEFTDFEPGELAVGDPVRMSFRIKDLDSQRGFRRYFWKATPPVGGQQ